MPDLTFPFDLQDQQPQGQTQPRNCIGPNPQLRWGRSSGKTHPCQCCTTLDRRPPALGLLQPWEESVLGLQFLHLLCDVLLLGKEKPRF